MRKRRLVFLMIFTLICASAGYVDAQGRGKGRGRGGQRPSVGRQDPGRGRSHPQRPNRDRETHRHTRDEDRKREKQPLSEAQLNSGAFRKLQDTTGMNGEQLQSLYEGSGARNFGQFNSAIMVSDKLGLNRNQVLEGLHDRSLGEVLKDLGVGHSRAEAAMEETHRELKRPSLKRQDSKR